MSYTSFSQVYDSLTANVDYKKRAEYICKILSRYKITDGLLLDLACGTGSLSLELSKRGFEVIGTDASADMLAVARMKAMEEGENILFLCQRMEETDLYGTVGAIVCALDSINHLPDCGALKKTFSVLKNFIDYGGIMIFDVNTIYKHREILGNNTYIYDEKDVFCAWQNRLLKDGITVDINLDFFLKGPKNTYSRFSEHFKEIAFSDAQITAAVSENGFTVLKRYGELSENGPAEDAQRVFYVVRRNSDE